MSDPQRDKRFLLNAIELSRDATPSQSAFSVGCVIVAADDRVVATGYSRERGAHSHAEEVAIEKADEEDAILAGSTLYSSLEPCSVRSSGMLSCASRILQAGIPRVVFAMREPPVFVEGCGAEVLARAGVEVVEDREHAGLVAQINAHLLGGGR